jgi:DNA-binding GntR family transcriptional regulator
MPRRAALQQLSRQFSAAVAQADWEAMGKLSASLAKNIPLLAERGAWNTLEQTELLQLRKIHAQAVKICSEEKERLGQHLGALQANKEGWVAYAALGEYDSEGYQA